MPTISFHPSLADQVRTLPANGAARNRRLQRLLDLYASAEAAAALQAAAARNGTGVLASADAVFGGSLVDRELVTDATRDAFRDAVTAPAFLSLLPAWIAELRDAASAHPESGACTVATALQLWKWTLNHLRGDESALDELAEIVCPLLAARCLALDAANSDAPQFRRDLSLTFAARAAARTGALCAEHVFGRRRHLVWDAEGCATCYGVDELDGLEAVMPGIASTAGLDVIGADGSHPAKAGPCTRFHDLDGFMNLRRRLDGCLTGARAARDRAALVIAEVRA